MKKLIIILAIFIFLIKVNKKLIKKLHLNKSLILNIKFNKKKI